MSFAIGDLVYLGEDLKEFHPGLSRGLVGEVLESRGKSCLVGFILGEDRIDIRVNAGQVVAVPPEHEIRAIVAEWKRLHPYAGQKPGVANGVGTFKPPPFTDADLAAIQARADAVADPQVKTDVFRLLHEVGRLRKVK